MIKLILLCLVAAAPIIAQDSALDRPLDKKGQSLPLSEALEHLEQATGRPEVLSSYVTDDAVFVGSSHVPSVQIMRSLAGLLTDRQYTYRWFNAGTDTTPKYLLSRAAPNQARVLIDSQQRLARVLANSPRYSPKPVEQITANDAIPARYELLRNLPPDVQRRAVSTALQGTQVNLPLELFNRNTLIAATGKVTVASGRDPATRKVTFTWKSIAVGDGYVALHRSILPDGNVGLKISIRSGQPAGDADQSDGPTLDLISGADDQKLRLANRLNAAVPSASGSTTGSDPTEPEITKARVTIHNDLRLEKSERPLHNVLKQLAAEEKLAVVGKWPVNYRFASQRLPKSLINVPLDEAVQEIAGFYHLQSRRQDIVIEFKPKVR